MAVKLSEADYPELMSWVEQHLPLSFKVHGELNSHLRGHCPAMEFFVDRWPHPQALVARENPAGQQMLSQFVEVNAFGVKEKDLSNLLKNPSVVSWDKRLKFSVLPSSLVPLLQTLAEERGKSVIVEPDVLLKATPEDLKPLPIPEGLMVQPISNAEVKMIYSTWKFSFRITESYIQNLVQKFPSVYLVTENGHHVGHMIGNSYGAMGMLYVNPDFRGKGFAKVIISQLSQKYLDHGEDVYVLVEDHHLSSQNLHKSMGFKEVCEEKFVFVMCE